MTVKSLRLANFRNYALQEIEFGGSLNVIYGNNAQGKTNILEAVFLCSTGRSHRTPKDTDMIRLSEDSLSAEVVFARRGFGDVRIAVEIHRNGRKAISVNGVPLRRMGDIMGHLNSVMFSPDDLGIIKSEPQARRRFLDMFISQVKPSYFFCLHQYMKILRQRNALLRQAREDRGLRGTIEAWDLPLADAGARIMCERRQFAAKLGRMAREGHAGITGGGEDLEICYAQSAKMPDGAEDAQIGDIRDAYLRQLRKSADIDVMRMSTTCGPHKDDLLFRLDGRNIRVYGSQGQQRTAALALKIAQVGVMREETGHLPVLLLDDVMSELDSARQAHIPLSTWDAQAIITCTGRESAPAFGRRGASGDAELGESDKSSESANGADSDGGAEEAGEAGGAREAEEAGHGGRVYFFVSGGTVRREC